MPPLTVVLHPAFENVQNGYPTVSGDGKDEGKGKPFFIDRVECLKMFKLFRRTRIQSYLSLFVR